MRRHPRRTQTDPANPRAWGTSDQNGMIGQHNKMKWQHDWRGPRLVNLRILVHEDELDLPQRQLGNLYLPADPPPIRNARPENYTIDEQTDRVTMGGVVRYQMNGLPRIQSNLQGGPAPSPVLALSPATIASNATIGTVVGYFAVYDGQNGPAYTYSLLTNPNNLFSINGSALVAAITPLVVGPDIISVNANNYAGNVVTSNFTVTVTNASYIPSLDFSIASNSMYAGPVIHF